MKNKKYLLTLLLFCICFIFLVPSFSTNFNSSAIINISGNRFVLTGLVGNEPQHYFTIDDSNTLYNIEIFDNDQTHYSLKQGDNNVGAKSSGSAEILPTSDMTALINKGIVYFEASMVVTSKKDNLQSNIMLKINYDNDKEISVNSNNSKGQTSTLTTGLIQLTQGTKITYSFQTLEENTKNDKSDFIIDMPCIKFYTQIESVTLNMEENITINSGEYLPINAYNEVTNVTGVEGNFINYSKVNHKINYNFVSGGEYVTVIGDKIYIDPSTPEGTNIKFNVYSKKNSYNSEEYVYSYNYVNITVRTEKVALNILTDFENPGTITGSGIYDQGERVTLTASTNSGYEFIGWQVNGEIVSTKNRYIIEAKFNDEIYAKYKKLIKISSISTIDKVYDGTTSVDKNNLLVYLDGVENGHEVKLEGIESVNFSTKNAGVNLPISIKINESGISLSGENSDIYKLSNYTLPTAYGNILPRVVIVKANDTYKQYGQVDPTINMKVENLISSDKLTGSLTREEGESVGEYKIYQGNLGSNDINYQVNFIETESKFYITQREVTLKNIIVEEKTYDKTVKAEVNAELTNVLENEKVYAKIDAEFNTANVGYNQVIITNVQLFGENANNYVYVDYQQDIYGQINQASLQIKVPDITITYGDEFNINIEQCEINGLYDGDLLLGQFEMNGKDANLEGYDIGIGSISNSNYKIDSFEAGKCVILPKNINVWADSVEKDYGDEDPTLTFINSKLEYDDILQGSLSRQKGEDCGYYEIFIGSLSELNPNYNINFISNNLIINKREINVIVEFLNKEYDGNKNVSFEVSYDNNIKNEEFDFTINSVLDNFNCGIANVIFDRYEVITNNTNYIFKYEFKNSQIEILRKQVNILIENQSKVYGDYDPEIKFSIMGIVNDDVINGNLTREAGEDKGIYYYTTGTITDENNPNYHIVLSNSYLEILPKEILVTIKGTEKTYGDKDPDFSAKPLNEDDFVYPDKSEEVLSGTISRQLGESAGIYKFDISNLCKNENYTLVLDSDCQFLILRRNVTVTIEDSTKTYGDDDPEYIYSVSNLFGDDVLIVNIGRDYGEDVGSYELYCKTLSDDRYIIETVVRGNLTIVPRPITIKAEQKIKIYGDKDPTLSVIVTNGRLVDDLTQISQGALAREEGENVGTYNITIGNFSLGKNYDVTFESGQFTIMKSDITISANYSSKQYGDDDPVLTYQITKGSLKFNDNFQGKLSRVQGEELGEYLIEIGSLQLNSNYNLTYISNTFKIEKRTIEIVPTVLSKTYGDEDPDIEYKIIGSIVFDDESEFVGEVYREKDKEDIEPVGKYKIYCSLYHENYNIVFKDYYFEILPRQITIIADDKSINYGDLLEPELTYSIEGEILEIDRDKLTGEIYRTSGNNAGKYYILSSLNLGKNYDIIFIKGIFTINPLNLVIECVNYEKVYGQVDPKFSYNIIEGNLLGDDKLSGGITREQGEDVGMYKLVSNLRNNNYNISINEAYLSILPKDVYLVTSIYDKTYDGTKVAYLKNPYVTGLLDKNVSLEYDRENCARFETSEVGNKIKVYLYDISLSGDKAGNYNIILPTDIYANIAEREISVGSVTISSPETAVLYKGYKLEYSNKDISNNDIKIKSHKSLASYDIKLSENSGLIDINTTVTISIQLDKNIYSNNNLYVYKMNEEGEYQLVSSYKEDGMLVIITDELGEFIIVTDNDDWINIGMFISIGLLLILFIFFITRYIITNKKLNKYKNN